MIKVTTRFTLVAEMAMPMADDGESLEEVRAFIAELEQQESMTATLAESFKISGLKVLSLETSTEVSEESK